MRDRMKRARARLLVAGAVAGSIIAVALPATQPGSGVTCDLTATTGNFSTQFAAATGGQTVCLAAGSYTLSNPNKNPAVTLTPADGVAKSAVVFQMTGSSSQGVTFDGVTVDSIDVGSASTGGTYRNITVRNSDVDDVANTGSIYFKGCGSANTGLLIENSTLVGQAFDTYEGRIHFVDRQAGSCGATIRNNLFDGGCADGIQTGADGIVVGPGNEFRNILQGPCPAGHIDPIQCVGCVNVTVTGNYLHDNTTTVMAADGGSTLTITHNAIYANNDGRAVNLGSITDATVEHNTLRGTLMNKVGNLGTPTTGTIIRNNVITSGVEREPADSSSVAVLENNLMGAACSFCPAGTGNIIGSPTFTGGALPASYDGHHLAVGSLGKGAASDGTDMGIG